MSEDYLLEKWVETKNGKIFYFLDKLFANKPFVVFIHGLSSNHTTWLNIIKVIHNYGYNSLAVDLRGHGLSDKTKKRSLYHFPVFSDDLDKILKKEKIDRGFLVGYSYGGPIALDFSLKHLDFPLGLVLISANHINPWEYKRIKFLTPIGYIFLNLLGFLLLWQKRKEYYYYRQGASRGYWNSVFEGFTTMPLSINFWMLSQMAKVDFKETISDIRIRTLVIRAPSDPFLSEAEAGDMVRAMPNAELITTKHESHFLASYAQEEISQLILNFLRED